MDNDLDWIARLSSLTYLNMNEFFVGNDIRIFNLLNQIPSLVEIHLSGCGITSIPRYLAHINFSSLSVVDLSDNPLFDTDLPGWLFNLSKLEHLDFSFGFLRSCIPPAIENLSMLKYLDLSYTNMDFQCVLPSSLAKLCHLETLYLMRVNISRDLSELDGIFSGCIKNSLQDLNLYNTGVKGHLPQWLWDLRKLKSLALGNNQLNRTISEGLGLLFELAYLELSNNELEGVMSEAHFKNLTKLKYLSLGYNSLSVKVQSNWLPTFQLEYIDMASCYLGPQFPAWLRTQKSATVIYMSNASIVGPLPDWFLRFVSNANDVDISYNQISGRLPDLIHLGNLKHLTLSCNCFVDHIPHFPSSLLELDLSNNSFSSFPNHMNTPDMSILSLSSNILSGEIPSFFCQLKYLLALDLSNNRLFGDLPNCWNHLLSIQYLDFSNNKDISGVIPDTIGNLDELSQLRLSNSNLYGVLPLSLSKCRSLTILDLGNNNLNGEVPIWIGESLQYLLVLKLGSNALSGSIPTNLSNLTLLHILDLSTNNLLGNIPQNIGNFTAMKDTNPNRYGINASMYFIKDITITVKGKFMQYNYYVLSLVISIDLSNNHISGGIPKEITYLSGLVSLGLSRNHLIGEIPKEIGNLKYLQSLDLSMNSLSGTIPSSMASLTSLSFLNLSYNNLSGEIPQSTQMLTFLYAYEGNPKLCGYPLATKCKNNQTSEGQTEALDTDEVMWFYISAAPGFVVGFWAVWGTLLLKKKWKNVYFQVIDSIFDGIYVFVVVNFSLSKSIT